MKILIVDDHPVFREGLQQVLRGLPEFQVVAEAGDGAAALRLARDLEPDVVLLDIDMPGLDGFAVARELRAQRRPITVVFLTMYQEEDMFNEAMDLGAKGYILKDSAVSDLLHCLRTVAADRHYISPTLSEYLLTRSERARSLLRRHPALERLTPAERRILRLIAEDRTSKEIADALGLSPRTVENHRTNISTKLGLHGAHSLVKFAFEHKSSLCR